MVGELVKENNLLKNKVKELFDWKNKIQKNLINHKKQNIIDSKKIIQKEEIYFFVLFTHHKSRIFLK